MPEDKEAVAIAKVIAALAELDASAINRVLRWAGERYGIASALPVRGSMGQESRQIGENDIDDIATVFHLATPKTDAERVLIAGYWFQELQGHKDLSAQTINGSLKHLGEGVSNVTAAFRKLIESKPALAMQIQKSGKSQQARKKYRLTTAGIACVRSMFKKDS